MIGLGASTAVTIAVVPIVPGYCEKTMADNVHYLPKLSMADAMQQFGLTARALRFYEEKGLLHAHRDRQNARYFDSTARRRLEWIARLRKAGLSLPAIREVLSAEDADGRGRACAVVFLLKRQADLHAELDRVGQILSDTRAAPGAAASEPRRRP
jgi:DNA-binding transcriptional MerR regulator